MSQVTYTPTKTRIQKIMSVVIPLILIVLIGVGGWFGYAQYKASTKKNTDTVATNPASSSQNSSQDQAVPASTSSETSQIFSSASSLSSLPPQDILFDTKVARVTGQKTLIVSSDNTNFKYIVVQNNDNTIQKLTTGQRVKINGKKSPTPATADMSSNWQLAASEIVAAQQYDYFIDAQQIQIVLD